MKKNLSLTNDLLSWFFIYGRNLPWRSKPTFYHVWLSEIMLQQTRVEAVKEYYARFLNALPDIQALADCEEDTYLKLWQGLGYYSRVRNLHKGALVLTSMNHLPETYEELIQIPGIGAYTAKAILSIVYQKPYVAVDGNLLRVFARLTSYPEDIKTEKAKEDCNQFFLPYLGTRPGDFNQALMDLGEAVCLPHGEPKCQLCPFQNYCQSHLKGNPTDYPIRSLKKEKKTVSMTVFLIEYQGKYLIEKRPDHGLLASLYQFPNIDQEMTIEETTKHLCNQGYTVSQIEDYHQAKHIFTHLIWQMQGYHIVLNKEPILTENQHLATLQELQDTYSIPSAFKAFLKTIILEGEENNEIQ